MLAIFHGHLAMRPPHPLRRSVPLQVNWPSKRISARAAASEQIEYSNKIAVPVLTHDSCHKVSQLWIVDPRCNPWDGEAHKIACSSYLMESMVVVPTMQEALASTSASIGFTRRAGNTRLVHSSLSQLLQKFQNILPNSAQPPASSSSSAEGSLALVFGREESGLTEQELSLCTHSCSIPTGAVQPSLNLSHAVCVILAQLFERRASSTIAVAATSIQQLPKQHQPASRKDLDALIHRWTELTREAGLGAEDSVGGTGSHGRKRRTVGHIKAVLSRAQITTQEARALQGLCSALSNIAVTAE